MMSDLKLTSKDMTTHGGTLWRLGEWRETSGEGPLCSEGWIHYYHDATPELAVALDPIHANFGEGRRLFRVEIEGQQRHEALKSGTTRLRLVEELDCPTITTDALVRWAIYVTRAIPGRQKIPEWESWADRWLAGERAAQTAWAAAAAVSAWTAEAPIDYAGLLARAIGEERGE